MFDSSKWNIISHDDELVSLLSSSLGIDKICAKLLINRGYNDESCARAFIDKSDVCFHSPFLLRDMDKAVRIIEEAIKNESKITIYGDYDVDGVTSVSILYMYLREHGANVDYYIPTRESEGYGLNTAAFDSIKQRGTDLVITVDTGITAIEEIDYANSIGLKVVVSDHHQCRQTLPNAEAIVNPKRPDCEYPFKELSGVGVVFKILCALELDYINAGEYNIYTIKDMCKRYIDIVTIGTVADVMPLIGENRIIVHLGLALLQNVHHVGIRALFRAVGVIGGNTQKRITASTIGFSVAPKINAVGRIGSAERAVELFLTSSPSQAEIIAEELCAINRQRQDAENIIYKEALEQISKENCDENEFVLVLESDSWHHGVIGIVASRITEKFGVPSVLISFDGAQPDENGKRIGKGSVRSTKGINIVEALENCSEYLCKFGGHALAAGLSIEEGNVDSFRTKLNEYIGNAKKNVGAVPLLDVDAEISSADISEKTADSISLLEPYGAGNLSPLFVLKNVTVSEIVSISSGKHTKMTVEKDGRFTSAVLFGTNLITEGFGVGDCIDIVGGIDINEFRGTRTPQLIVKDVDYSQDAKRHFSEVFTAVNDVLNCKKHVDDSDVPQRDDCVLLYRALKNCNGEYFNCKSFVGKHPEFTYIKLAIIFEMFNEAGLLRIERKTINPFVIKCGIIEATKKIDLFETKIIKSIINNKDLK